MALEQVKTYQVQQPVQPQRRQDQQPQPQQQPVKKPWFTKGEKVLYTFGIALVAVLAVIVVSFSSSVDTLNRDVQQLQTQVQDVQAQNNSLHAEVQELSNPNRILTIAEENGLNIRNAEVRQANNTP
ncbi:cell division protein FtsL [Alkalibacillus haloalkaliphilus]|uniref:cell division protein FtsL n=1 Tax=Alkalibacillus haloalkaliphilus TaxID=94136 RepID=UPI002935F8F2|nr:cell division protein FtsL [Alkalibacillus haloalkaliphilus]MDV2582543.1 cell division protein FtsL [Alkalibacillus haloalkaliphilus]